ncbi:MAG: ribonuclease H-like domain-containing protein [Ignavibacteriales bacterium]|nr:ribonuclease H-like domain-containing protein [Ignavibacteriales bacterium]
MASLIFDIETLAHPLTYFDEKQQEYLFKFCKTEEERVTKIQELALSPLTASVIAIGMVNPETERGKVVYLSDEVSSEKNENENIEFLAVKEEREILSTFWNDVKHFDQIITFNGRGFDCPFLMVRSAVLSVKPTRNLMPYRYDTKYHCDLLEQLTFYNATRRFSLDFYCKSFGIQSPKESGITGLELPALYEQKRFREIAEYCIGDVLATSQLYKRWKEFIALETS